MRIKIKISITQKFCNNSAVVIEKRSVRAHFWIFKALQHELLIKYKKK